MGRQEIHFQDNENDQYRDNSRKYRVAVFLIKIIKSESDQNAKPTIAKTFRKLGGKEGVTQQIGLKYRDNATKRIIPITTNKAFISVRENFE